MATTIQLLRSDIPQQRPDPGVLANGVPMVNINETEPGLFFAARDGSLFKVGPASVGDSQPNSTAQGEPGNCLGELWVDTSGSHPDLKYFDGSEFISAFTAPQAVTSVGLSFSSIFTVDGSPITSTGTLNVSPSDQAINTVFAGPASGPGGTPSFRALVESDIPAISASKITTGTLDSGRIPGLDASKVVTGTFSNARIPNLNANKITSGVLSYEVGGTGIQASPSNGELLIGNGVGWSKATLTAGQNIAVSNGSGSVSVGVVSSPTFSTVNATGVLFLDSDGDTLTVNAPAVSASYTLKLPSSDGTNGAILVTDGSGQLSFQTSLFGLASIGGAGAITINAGGANNNVILAPTGTGVISASSRRISNLATPAGSTDAATKAYVDAIAAGIQPKAQVAAASTANIDLATGGLLTIDTVVLAPGDRVLVKDQTSPAQNGIYIAAAGSWTRAADANTFAKLVNAVTFVAGGSANLGNSYLCNSPSGGTLGVSAVDWVLYSSGAGTVTSVGISMPAEFSIANSPVTTSGTLSVAYANQTANTVLAGPSGGGSAQPTFRALTAADIPSTLSSHTFSGIATFQSSADFQGNCSLGNDAADLISFDGTVDTDILPLAAGTCSLGSDTNRWANVYTNDLNLSNEGGANDIDGTWGSYVIQEGESDLFLINKRTGKRYKFLLQEI